MLSVRKDMWILQIWEPSKPTQEQPKTFNGGGEW